MTKTSKPKINIFKQFRRYLVPTTLSVILFVLVIFTFEVIVADKYYPRTFAGDTNISFLSQGQAIRAIQAKFDQRINQKLSFTSGENTFTIDIATASASLDYSSLTLAFNSSRNGPFFNRLQKQFQALFLTNQVTPKISLNLDKQTESIQTAINKPYTNAQLIFNEVTTSEGTPSAKIQIKEGINGLALDKEALNKQVTQFILMGKYTPQLPTRAVPPKVTTQQLTRAKEALENIAKEPIKLRFENSNWTIDTKQLLTLLDVTNGSDTLLSKDQTYLYLGKIADEVNQNVQEGLFEFNPTTKRVSAFKPSQEGRSLDLDKTYQLLIAALPANASVALQAGLPKDGEKTINLPVNIVKPKTQTADVNSLGIKELIGRGISNFAGSIPNRVYNVNLTASKINGVLIPPGEVFSFDQAVGDITAEAGFKQAYVIKGGRTVLDDGGGVCQDSTTLFRAVLHAGLPVLQRTAHAYRVGYYEQGFPPGLDATIFSPSVDFQFKNDTPSHILIQAYTSGLTLYVDLYGTSDGRVATLTTPVVTNITPAPPELRQDDPTLPKGTVKQVDFAAKGADVSFKRTVTRGGETLAQETWKSFYKPWQAVYLVGTQ